MTNKTQEQTQSRGRLLIVEDNPRYALNAVRAARARGYEVDVAFDLKGAMSYLQSGSYAGLITDLQFYEEGINDVKTIDSRENLSDLEKGLIEPVQTKKEVRADLQLRERIASELATPEYASQLASLRDGAGRLRDLFLGNESPEKLQRALMENPAMGYEVIKYAQDHHISLAVVSSVSHGQQCIPALFKTKLADAGSLMRNESVRFAERERVEGEKKARAGFIFEKKRQGALTEDEMKSQLKECSATFKPRLERLNALVLDRAILVMQEGKEQHTYDFAIDLLEGRIDQTRPYRVKA